MFQKSNDPSQNSSDLSRGEQIADAVARFGGSWTFIISFLTFLAGYVTANVVLAEAAWDPYPYILLNLFLSMLAAIQAPVIMMSQNRQDAKDRQHASQNHILTQRAEREIQLLNRRLAMLMDQIADLQDSLEAREK